MLTYEEATKEIALPFIRKGISKGKRRRTEIIECYWDVTPTGDFATDHNLAQEYALAYMEYEHRALALRPPAQRVPLAYIVADMVKQGIDVRNNQMASGFLFLINNISMDEWTPAVIGYWRKYYEKEHKFLVEHCKRQDAERSARNRRAALIGVAKRRKVKRLKKRGAS